jgi:Fe-S-cluster containining protein
MKTKTVIALKNQELPAGDFSSWLDQTRLSLQGKGEADVPCGDCTGCCTSSYFIHVKPEDVQTLSKVPKKLLVPAPGLPRGHKLMGFSRDGTCPMLAVNKCSIYEHRPRTCREYDCRIFAAAGIPAGGSEKAVINERVRQWKFSYKSAADRRAHDAIRAAASFVQENKESFPNGRVPTNPGDIAVLAIKVYTVFLDCRLEGLSKKEIAEAIVRVSRQVDQSSVKTPGKE